MEVYDLLGQLGARAELDHSLVVIALSHKTIRCWDHTATQDE